MGAADIRIRKALPEDVPVLRRLIESSVRELQVQDYTPAQMEGALESVFGVDSQLIADGSYLVAEARIIAAAADSGSGEDLGGEKQSGSGWTIAGCGGWSKRKTLYGGDRWTAREDSLLDPKRDAAKIRAFFIHPAWARRGVGSKGILEAWRVSRLARRVLHATKWAQP